MYLTPRALHLDVVQGSKEERVKRTQKYVERVTDAADEAIRQEPAGAAGFAGGQGGRCGGRG